jgi:Arc-like DNA binding domain
MEVNMKDSNKATPTPLRIPDDLKTWLKHQAIDNRRSLNSELLHRLEQSRAHQQTQGATQ